MHFITQSNHGQTQKCQYRLLPSFCSFSILILNTSSFINRYNHGANLYTNYNMKMKKNIMLSGLSLFSSGFPQNDKTRCRCWGETNLSGETIVHNCFPAPMKGNNCTGETIVHYQLPFV